MSHEQWIWLTETEKRVLIYDHLKSLENLIEATEKKVKEKNYCPPCNQNCNQGRNCPNKT